jgi:hypothetical protein
MLGHVRTIDHRMLTRRCVACGYEGRSLLKPGLERCPRCSCDLRSRPPRSYAEMEGLVGSTPRIEPRQTPAQPTVSEHMIHRWLAFLFMALLGLLAIVYLSAAAVAI